MPKHLSLIHGHDFISCRLQELTAAASCLGAQIIRKPKVSKDLCTSPERYAESFQGYECGSEVTLNRRSERWLTEYRFADA